MVSVFAIKNKVTRNFSVILAFAVIQVHLAWSTKSNGFPVKVKYINGICFLISFIYYPRLGAGNERGSSTQDIQKFELNQGISFYFMYV